MEDKNAKMKNSQPQMGNANISPTGNRNPKKIYTIGLLIT